MRSVSIARAFSRLVVIAAFALVLSVFLAVLPSSSPQALGEPVTHPSSDIKGDWILVSGVNQGEASNPEKAKAMQLSIDETNLVLRTDGRDEKCTYKLDASKSPMWLDLTPVGADSKTISAICEIQDGMLRICFLKDGGERPTDFNADKTNHRSLLVLKRLATTGIEGTWTAIDATKEGMQQGSEVIKKLWVTIDGRNFSINVGDNKSPIEYRIDTNHSPAWIDFVDGQTDLPGIFELKDGVLKVCFSKNGGTRPTAFAADRENQNSLLILKRGEAPATMPASAP